MIGDAGSFAEQSDAQAAIGAALLPLLPAGATSIVLRARALTSVTATDIEAHREDGSIEYISAARRFDPDLVARLREVMYREETGTWFSAVIEVDSSGTVRTSFDYDDEPDWSFPIDPIAYVTDQERYPRSIDNQPPWLRAILEQAGGT